MPCGAAPLHTSAGHIGHHFPPGDSRWKGASSDQFLRHAGNLVQASGGRIVNLDVTLICERPKIGPVRASMRRRIAEILALAEERSRLQDQTELDFSMEDDDYLNYDELDDEDWEASIRLANELQGVKSPLAEYIAGEDVFENSDDLL